MSTLEVVGGDNRGSAEIPFGFVYFNDGLRVLYTGETKHGELQFTIDDSSGGWGPVTRAHRKLAGEYLRQKQGQGEK